MRDVMKSLKRKCRIYIKNRKYNSKGVLLHAATIKDEARCFDMLIDDIVHEIEQYRKTEVIHNVQGRYEIKDYTILSYNGDRMGKVISCNGEILRGIYPESVNDFLDLWHSGLLQVLGNRGMIPNTELTLMYSDEYPIILKHEKVCMSVSSTWNFAMIKDASILISLIKRIANRVGFTLHDGHLNNVTFSNGKPVFTDIGSIVKDRGQETVCDKEIVFTGCYRMVSEVIGNSILKHYQLYDESNNAIWVSPREYSDMVREYQVLLRHFKKYHTIKSSLVCRRMIREIFQNYNVLPEYINTLFSVDWKEHNRANYEMFEDCKLLIERISNLELDINSYVEVSAINSKNITEIYRKTGCTASVLSADNKISSAIYEEIKKEHLLINSYIFNYLYGASAEKIAPFVSDMAFVFNISQNCFAYQQYKCDSLLNSLSKLSKRYVAITYYPNANRNSKYKPYLNDKQNEEVEMFESVFMRMYNMLDKQQIGEECTSQDYRIMYIGQKKNEIS